MNIEVADMIHGVMISTFLDEMKKAKGYAWTHSYLEPCKRPTVIREENTVGVQFLIFEWL